MVTDLKQQGAAAFLSLLHPARPQQPARHGADVCPAAERAWLSQESHASRLRGAAQPNCLALLQLVIDPINSNESGFLQSDLLPLPVMCLSQSMKS